MPTPRAADLKHFVADLVEGLRVAAIAPDIATEGDLERRVVISLAAKLAGAYPKLKLYAHPWNNKQSCVSHGGALREQAGTEGCPRCWTESKSWSSVDVLGT